MQNGPTERKIPAQTETVCTGCNYLHKEGGVRGHRHITNNFHCIHPDFSNEHIGMSSKRGRTIELHHEGECPTPFWCPFVVEKMNSGILKKQQQ